MERNSGDTAFAAILHSSRLKGDGLRKNSGSFEALTYCRQGLADKLEQRITTDCRDP